MIDFSRKFKNFGPLEALVVASITYVVVMLLWTASTRSEVLQKANDIKSNHKSVIDFINNEVNSCSSNEEGLTSWGEKCNSVWTSSKIVNYILTNVDLKNPYSINKPLIQLSQDPRIQAEGKAGQSTDKGIIFVSSSNFEVRLWFRMGGRNLREIALCSCRKQRVSFYLSLVNNLKTTILCCFTQIVKANLSKLKRISFNRILFSFHYKPSRIFFFSIYLKRNIIYASVARNCKDPI